MSTHAVGQRWHTAAMTTPQPAPSEPVRGGTPSKGTKADKRLHGKGAKPGPKPGKK